MKDKVVIGTRGSKLALWQADWVKAQIEERNPQLKVELKKIKTTGDKILDVPLAKVGGKGLFVKEIEESLLAGESDLAVHSMKDVPTVLPDGLHIATVLVREDPRDAFITKDGKGSFKDLKTGANIGTSSLRRSCQLLAARPDLQITSLRGNLDTRLRKLDEGQFDAIILAAAGVRRLGFQDRITETLGVELSLPAIAQGAVGIECRRDDEFIHSIIDPLNHEETVICVRAERAFLKKLEGGCQVPIAAHATLRDGKLYMDGLVGSVKGDRILKSHREGRPEDAEAMGTELAQELLNQGADKILAEVYGQTQGGEPPGKRRNLKLMLSRYVIVQLIAAAVGGYVAARKGRNWAVWGLLCFLFPLFLLILFMMPRVLSAGVTKQCPECGRIIPHDAMSCDFCGKTLPIEMVQCPRCGKFVPEGHECPDCKR